MADENPLGLDEGLGLGGGLGRSVGLGLDVGFGRSADLGRGGGIDRSVGLGRGGGFDRSAGPGLDGGLGRSAGSGLDGVREGLGRYGHGVHDRRGDLGSRGLVGVVRVAGSRIGEGLRKGGLMVRVLGVVLVVAVLVLGQELRQEWLPQGV